MNRYESIIHDIFKEYELKGEMPSVDDVKTFFNSRIAVKAQEDSSDSELSKVKSFWEVYGEFTKECARQNDWTEATKKKFKTLKNHLIAFKKLNSFDYLTKKGLNDLVDYFRNKKGKLNSNYSAIQKTKPILKYV